MQLIDGSALADKIKDEIVQEILKMNGERPNLAIILIGDREDSQLYVKLKEKEAKKVGIDTHLYRCPENTTTEEVLEMIDFLNKDSAIDAILVQLPLPNGLDTDNIIAAIDPEKDVDMFHPDNLRILMSTCSHQAVIPPVYRAVLEMLKSIAFDLTGKRACILANSEIFGQGLVKVLECEGAQAVLEDSNDQELAARTCQADLLISALGQARFIKAEMIKDGAVIIDIGIVKEGGRIYGDTDIDDVKDKAGFATPVPGGVGPLTIAMAFQNTLELYKRRRAMIF